MRKHIPVLLILLLYLLIGTLFTIYTPPWEAPDEPAHYNYIRQLAAGNLPVIEPGDYNQDYISQVVFESHFDPAYPLDSMAYEDWQPPLYYLLLTPIYQLTNGSLTALRLTSLLIGAGIIVLAYAIAQHVLGQVWLASITAVFVALLPQHLAILAAINNDALAELLIAAILYLLVSLKADHRSPITDYRHWLTIGLLLGLGFLTKGTVYLMAPVIGLALIWHYWGHWQAFWQASWRVALPAFLLGALWWGRNILVYGGLDILGKAAHDAVVVGQPRTAEWIAQYGLTETAQRFLQTTFNSFWGQFGWMTVPMPTWIYRPLLFFTAIIIIGLFTHVFSPRPSPLPSPPSPLPTRLLLTTFLLALALHVGYNLTFVQHQGRYLYPALIPIGVGVAVGISVWGRPFTQRWPLAPALLSLGFALALAGLDLFALFRIILPNLG
ncbi:MAG: DUF2142 domain-containing protein [Ardenticatenaceae bacterium]|nr:DUF2142 domain-containing protein [Ardenticatenaceae bacterium]